jgi:hypothetical protein
MRARASLCLCVVCCAGVIALAEERCQSPAAAGQAADTTAPGSPLERALTGAQPDSSLPLGMSVATFAGTDRRRAYVSITLDVSAFATAPGSIPLEIAVVANDKQGRRVGGARQTGTVQVPPSAAAGAMTPFVELQTYLTLPPGDYELRAAVMNADTRAASGVSALVTVPSFEDAGLALSDVVLGTRENAGSLPEGAPAIPIVPTTARAFGTSEAATAFLRAYRKADSGAGQPVSIETSVVDNRGRAVTHQSLQNVAFAGRNADIRLPLPLKDLAPGRYVLRFDARQGRDETSRSIAFEVTPAQPSSTQEHSPELDAALAAAAHYIDQYEHRITAIGAEEEYDQAVISLPSGIVTGPIGSRESTAASPTTTTSKTRANIITISLGARGWVTFRDVFELDGRPVRDREERLSRILKDVNPESLKQARQIAAESARYNLDPDKIHIDRTINVPMTALLYLRAANQARSSFSLGKPERIAGINCVTLQFTEQSRPRLVRTSDDAPAQGTFWIDMANGGRVLKTQIRMQSGPRGQLLRSQTTVTYARVDKLDLWVPSSMDEVYELPATRQTITGHATYLDFREFRVTTSEGIK